MGNDLSLKAVTDAIAYELGNPNDYAFKNVIRQAILTTRALLLRRDYERTNMFRSSSLVTLNCVTLEKVNSTECCSVDLGCKILRSNVKIPKPLDIKDKPDFEYVGAIDSRHGFSMISPAEIEWVILRKFTGNLIYYTYANDRLYIINTLTVKKVKVRYVPANPMDLNGLNVCESGCFDIDADIILEADLIPLIKEIAFKELGFKKENDEINIEK
jgi:hypothetical protein